MQRISKTYRLQIVGPFDLDSVEVVQNPGKLVGKVFRLKRKGSKVNTMNLKHPFLCLLTFLDIRSFIPDVYLSWPVGLRNAFFFLFSFSN